MLPPFIIEQIRRLEEERERERERARPRVELPLERRHPSRKPARLPEDPSEEDVNRGVVIMEL